MTTTTEHTSAATLVDVPKDLTGYGRDKLLEMLQGLVADRTDAITLWEERGRKLHELQKHVTDLQTDGTTRVMASLPRVVRAFHEKFGHPVVHTPKVPDAVQVRFRLKLIAEEFFELLAACEIWASGTYWDGQAQGERVVVEAHQMIKDAIDNDFVDPSVVNLPEFADALTDLDWVVEGTRAVFGIWGPPILAEVARANMAKEPVHVATKDAHHLTTDPGAIKPTKPPGWVPPHIRQVLIDQGWQPPHSCPGCDGKATP